MEHDDITLPVHFGTSTIWQARCSCGWQCGTVYRGEDAAARARRQWEAHAHDRA